MVRLFEATLLHSRKYALQLLQRKMPVHARETAVPQRWHQIPKRTSNFFALLSISQCSTVWIRDRTNCCNLYYTDRQNKRSPSAHYLIFCMLLAALHLPGALNGSDIPLESPLYMHDDELTVEQESNLPNSRGPTTSSTTSSAALESFPWENQPGRNVECEVCQCIVDLVYDQLQSKFPYPIRQKDTSESNDAYAGREAEAAVERLAGEAASKEQTKVGNEFSGTQVSAPEAAGELPVVTTEAAFSAMRAATTGNAALSSETIAAEPPTQQASARVRYLPEGLPLTETATELASEVSHLPPRHRAEVTALASGASQGAVSAVATSHRTKTAVKASTHVKRLLSRKQRLAWAVAVNETVNSMNLCTFGYWKFYADTTGRASLALRGDAGHCMYTSFLSYVPPALPFPLPPLLLASLFVPRVKSQLLSASECPAVNSFSCQTSTLAVNAAAANLLTYRRVSRSEGRTYLVFLASPSQLTDKTEDMHVTEMTAACKRLLAGNGDDALERSVLNSDGNPDTAARSFCLHTHCTALWPDYDRPINRETQSDRNLRFANQFLEWNREQLGIHETTSGLQYRLEEDIVHMHYVAKTLSGKTFENTYRKGRASVVQFANLVPGWKEALQMMNTGDEMHIYMPPHLGFGQAGLGPPQLLFKKKRSLLFVIVLLAPIRMGLITLLVQVKPNELVMLHLRLEHVERSVGPSSPISTPSAAATPRGVPLFGKSSSSSDSTNSDDASAEAAAWVSARQAEL